MDTERTTIRMNRSLLARTRERTRARDQTFTSFIEDAVRRSLEGTMWESFDREVRNHKR